MRASLLRSLFVPISIVAAVAVALLIVSGDAAAKSDKGAGGVTGPAFYVDGELYRTVGTPNDLSDTGGPDHSFDTIYDFGMIQTNVATAAPGDQGYNGGRWRVHSVSFNTDMASTIAAHDANDSGDLDSAAEVASALADNSPSGLTDNGVVKSFTCPVIPLPGSSS